MMRGDRASAALGMRVDRDEPGDAVVTMVVRDDMTNGFEVAHGGIVFALADTAFAIACNEDHRVTVSSGADITFLRSARAGEKLTAHATRVEVRGRAGVYDVAVTDGAGEVIALVRGRSLTTDRPRPE